MARKRLAVAIAGILLAASGLVWLATRKAAPDEEAGIVAAERPGMALLERYRCHRAETKRIFLRGVEDGFSPEGEEKAELRPGTGTPRVLSLQRTDYDGSQADRTLLDHVELPSDIARGLFVVSLRAIAGNENDGITLGRIVRDRTLPRETPGFQSFIATLPQHSGWRRIGPIHYAELGDIELSSDSSEPLKGRFRRESAGGTLLDYVRTGDGRRAIDIQVSDDTSVDFVGIAVCERPPGGTGLSFVAEPLKGVADPSVVILGCHQGGEGERHCDPYRGATSCETALPVACFADRDRPRPDAVADAGAAYGWSGGEVAFTPPRKGSAFRSIADVDSLCRASFGPDWRTATYHEGGRAAQFTALGRPPGGAARVWIDIKGQPYATCWSR